MDPIRVTSNYVEGALQEISSAVSSLNMTPTPIENPTGIFLADTDANVNHSVEHLHQAFTFLNSIKNKDKFNVVPENITILESVKLLSNIKNALFLLPNSNTLSIYEEDNSSKNNKLEEARLCLDLAILKLKSCW